MQSSRYTVVRAVIQSGGAKGARAAVGNGVVTGIVNGVAVAATVLGIIKAVAKNNKEGAEKTEANKKEH